MTNNDIFNAIRNIDENLILGASPSEKAPSAKKKILLKVLTSAAAIILVISLSIGGVMMMRDDGVKDLPDNNKENNGWLNNGWYNDEPTSKFFYGIEEFDAYRNGPENIEGTTGYFDNSLYVDFDSIIPNSEIEFVILYNYDAYGMRYFSDENYSMSMDCYIDEDFVLSETEWDNKYIMDCRIEDLNDIRSGDNNYIFVVDGIEVLYQINKNSYGEISVSCIVFVIGNRVFAIYDPFIANTPSQLEFINAFRTEAGTSAMLNRIKALIPQ